MKMQDRQSQEVRKSCPKSKILTIANEYATEERLSRERRRLAEAARERLVKEIWDLELSSEQLDDPTRTLREELE